jgi:uncharacterized hydrophobic protein (TIGR00271 family)
MSTLYRKFRQFLNVRFSLTDDKDDDAVIVDRLKKEVQFMGTNLWTLIFAIFIASIGLNVNSTAVIIGAMLISPLMGPIMGIGLAVAINDFELLKKAGKNLAIAAVFSVATSALYFRITPLHDASSELLARTTPSLWDVFIAILGGLAGIVAATRKQKSNVIPGVAIATALMPPLCTAGYGLATGQLYYFLGAAYLFFINSLFICLATFVIVKHLGFKKVHFAAPAQEKRVSQTILAIVIITIIPSIYLAYRIVQKSIFEKNAKNFITQEFNYKKTQVISRNIRFDKKQSIELLLIGETLPDTVLRAIRNKLPIYNLDTQCLVITQGLDAAEKIDLSKIKASVLEEIHAINKAQDTIKDQNNKLTMNIPDIKNELIALYPTLISYSIHQSIIYHTDTLHNDTVTLFAGKFKKSISKTETKKLQKWIKERAKSDSVVVMIQ